MRSRTPSSQVRNRFFLGAVVGLAAFVWSAAAPAATLQESFQQGNERYWAGDFGGAARIYQETLERYRLDNPELYFNLANAHHKQGHLGAAVLYYKRALACDPDPDTETAAEHNLARVRSTLMAQHHQDLRPGQVLYDESHGVWYAVFHVMSGNALTGVFLVVYLLLLATLFARRLAPWRALKRAVKPMAIGFLCLTMIFAGLLVGNVLTTEHVLLGVVVQPKARLRSGRGPDAASVELPEGLEVRVLAEPTDGWVRIQLSNGREGYVAQDAVKEI